MKSKKINITTLLSIALFLLFFIQAGQTDSTVEAAEPAQFFSNLPVGDLDKIQCETNGVTGFAFDDDILPDHTKVTFWIDGKYAGSVVADAERDTYEDGKTTYSPGGDHGFVWTIPSKYKDGEKYKIRAYALNSGSLFGHPKIGDESFKCSQPKVSLENGSSFNELNGSIALTANMDGTYAEDVTVKLAYGGEAVWNIDFTGPNQIVIPAGQLSASITLSGRNDDLKEPTEPFTVDISSVKNGKENGKQRSTFSIIDDDSAKQNGLDVIPAANNSEVKNYFDGTFIGPGVVTTNFKQIGSANQFGTFSNGSGAIGASRLPLEDGVVMATGNVTTVSSPQGNTRGNFSSVSTANASDPDLVALSGSRIYDAVGFEFQFESVTDRIGFVFSFASEEYPEYVGTIFNDAFGFFIQGGTEYPSKTNVALVPGSNDGIAVNTINNGQLGQYAGSYGSPSVLTNSGSYISNSSAHTGDKSVGPYLEYDGLTTRLLVDAEITRDTLYTIKIAMGDAGDASWDSAVFFETNGFLALTSATDNDYAVRKTSIVAGNMILDDTGDGIDIDPEDGTDTLSVIEINGQPSGSGKITLPSGAYLEVSPDGSFTFDPSTSATYANLADGQTATETFTYTIVDDIGITDTATITIVVSGASVTRISCDSDGYLFNTGFSSGSTLGAGSLDLNWEAGVGDSSGPSSASQWGPAWVLGQKYDIWTTSPNGSAEWVGFNSDGAHFGDKDYFYRYQFDLDQEVSPSDFLLKFDFFADNSIAEIYVNGVPQSQYSESVAGIASGYFNQGYRSDKGVKAILEHDWNTGGNEIIVHVQTSEPSEGFLASATSQLVCPPLVTLSGGGEIMETGGVEQATLTLDKAVDYPVTVRLAYTGEAIHETDFDGIVEIVIPAGQLSISFDLTAIEDSLVEGPEDFTIEITELINGKEDGEQTANFTIIDVPPIDFTVEVPERLSCGSRAPISFITVAEGVVGVSTLVHTLPDGFELDENLTSIQKKAKAAYGSQTTAQIVENTITLATLQVPKGTTTFTLYVKPATYKLAGDHEFFGELTLSGAADPLTGSDTMNLSENDDHDGDGIPDCQDLDDDNDGIIDTIECGPINSNGIENGGFESPSYIKTYGFVAESQVPGWNTDASHNVLEIWESGFNEVLSHSGSQFVELNAHTNAALYQDVETTPGVTMDWSFAHRGRKGDDIIRLEFGPPGGPYTTMGEFVTGNASWVVYNGEYSVPASQSTTRFRYIAIDTASSISVGNFIDSIEFDVCSLDSDGDGVPNKYDLDSDNDGLTDLRESGQDPDLIDTNEDGIRDDMDSPEDVAANDRDDDGLADAVDDGNEVDPRDSDNDSVSGYIDIDSDNDGIPDHVEAQPTKDYQSPSNAVDRNGVSQVFNGSGLTPVDTDDDGTPDYLDRDSDGDTLPDIQENGQVDTISGKDSDGDGLDDNFEGVNANDPLDVNDQIDLPSRDLPDNDLDLPDDGDVDYRDDELTITGLVWEDADLDGVRQNNEPLFGGLPVAVYNNADELIDFSSTDETGYYEIKVKVAGLLNGYYVEFTRPKDFLFTLKNAGDPSFDSDPDPFSGETELLEYATRQFIDAGIFDELLDHGDAPAAYGDSYTAAGLPYESLWIGGLNDLPDTELTLPNSNGAVGDDLSGRDDEQGVTFVDSESANEISYYLDKDYEIDITVYNPRFDTAYLEGWIDFNGNNVFDSNETIVSRQIGRSAAVQPLSGLTFNNPIDAACGDTYARFRFAATQLTEAYGYAGFGETEDYRIFIDCRTDLQIKATINPTPTVQLSEFIDFDVSVVNNGPNPARDMTVTFTYPEFLTDLVPIPVNGWECAFDVSQAICTKNGLAIGEEEQVFTFSGRVPGTYPDDDVSGLIRVDQVIEDLVPSNNALDYLVEVDKQWTTVPNAQYIADLFLYTRFDEELEIIAASDRDFLPDDLIVNPLNIPIDIAPGIKASSYPTLTTPYCVDNGSAIGCDRDTDIITGTILVQSYDLVTMTLQAVDESNLISSVKSIALAPDGSGRHADSDPDNCLGWSNELGGYCMAPYEVWAPWGPFGSGGKADLYAWTEGELTQLIFESAGGRGIGCQNQVGNCLKFEDAKPGIYILQGSLEITYLFHDPDILRLGEPTLNFSANVPFSFYIQVVAPFTEAE
ncbi:MAG: choice-of-anchor L domain-containing protein [Anaerolineae bacterium]